MNEKDLMMKHWAIQYFRAKGMLSMAEYLEYKLRKELANEK